MPTIQKIMFLKTIRKIIDESFSEDDVYNGNYFDVMEKIQMPSDDGDYKNFDAVATVSKKQSDFIKSVINPEVCKIAYICL